MEGIIFLPLFIFGLKMHYTYNNMEQTTTFQESEPLWADYRQQLYLFILKRVNDPLVAEDIVQDVMMKVLLSRDSVRDDEKLRPWLYQITRNAIVDYYHARKPAQELSEDLLLANAESEESVSQELAQCCIRPFIEQLPAPYQEAILLSELDGLTQAEVAKRQNISLSGAKSRVQRGRQLLKGALLQCCQFEFDHLGQLTDYEPQQKCTGC
jgi:RNA polymerase sigma-70 factor (ECF subfamily)